MSKGKCRIMIGLSEFDKFKKGEPVYLYTYDSVEVIELQIDMEVISIADDGDIGFTVQLINI